MERLENVIIISLDCVRKESLSCYEERFDSLVHKTVPIFSLIGARKIKPISDPVINLFLKSIVNPSTPNIDKIAKDGIIFFQAISQAPFTPSSHASVFTGLNPFNHGIRAMVGYKLNDRALTLAERLKIYNYNTGGFIGADALGSSYGLNRGFDKYEFQKQDFVCTIGNMNIYRRDCKSVTYDALDWLNNYKNDKFFLFIHYFDAHELDHGPTYHPFFQINQAKRIDKEIGKIIKFLINNNLYEKTIIIIVSDHGNDFGIHEAGHREYLYDSTLLVPLIIKADEQFKGKIISGQVRLIDIIPTILEFLRIPLETPKPYIRTDGISLVKYLNSSLNNNLPAYSETCIEVSTENWMKFKMSFMSLRLPKWKLIVNRIDGSKQLFDLKNDPKELKDVYRLFPKIAEKITTKLYRMIEKSNVTSLMSEEDREKIKDSLKALGYL